MDYIRSFLRLHFWTFYRSCLKSLDQFSITCYEDAVTYYFYHIFRLTLHSTLLILVKSWMPEEKNITLDKSTRKDKLLLKVPICLCLVFKRKRTTLNKSATLFRWTKYGDASYQNNSRNNHLALWKPVLKIWRKKHNCLWNIWFLSKAD